MPRLSLIRRWSPPSGGAFIDAGFEEIIVPSIWEAATFLDKVGEENARMMWTFEDKGGRSCCLIPEVTGLLQETWRTSWRNKAAQEQRCSPEKACRDVFYTQRAYRYERPQAGRYREFTQLGIEMLGSTDTDRAKTLLRTCLDAVGVDYRFDDAVARGLSYYVDAGFEAAVDSLGAQKQVAGGGAYAEGVGWAVGVDRLVLAKLKSA